jgi:aromatic-L-amino-acid decarboxylase
MTPETFRTAAHVVVDVMADYLASVESRPVFPNVEPGSLKPLFPGSAPEIGEPLDDILADYKRLIEPNATHWQHPAFLAYFSTTASGPGILGEMLTAALGQNPMLWRTSPIGTELEIVVVDWLRQALGLPQDFQGLLTDTASTSTLIAMAAAREALGVDVAMRGLAGRPELGPGYRVYASTEAHTVVDKACMTLGLGRSSLVPVPTNDRFEMTPEALEAAIDADRGAGLVPMAVVATIGTTSSTSVDPVVAIADIAARERIWLHVDSAYAGATAILPERRGPFEGWERADSIVVNPHKWLFTPLDASLLLTPRMDDLRAAFSLVPEYLRTLDREAPVHDFNEFTPQLGRRFRALKLWIQLRTFGLEGLRAAIRGHLALASALRDQVGADPDWEILAPMPFATLCVRWRPATLADRTFEREIAEHLDRANNEIMNAVNKTGEAFLSHTRLGGRFTIRIAIGNLRTEARHVERAWELLRAAAAEQAIPA